MEMTQFQLTEGNNGAYVLCNDMGRPERIIDLCLEMQEGEFKKKIG